jgi:hypothetical protein
MDKDLALLAAATVFGIVTLVNLVRLLLKFEIKIAGKLIPLWVNMIGFSVAAIMCAWMLLAR